MWFATYLYQQGLVSADDVMKAVARQLELRPPIGRLALEQKKMTVKQVANVLAAQADRNEQFGCLAVKLGYISELDLAWLLMVQSDQTKPLGEIFVEMGAIDSQTLNAEGGTARRLASSSVERLATVEHAR